MKIFPLKKLPLISVLVAVFLAIGLILFVGTYSKKGVFSRTALIESQDKDSDNDGLKDWEEELYKTDPYNSDTDFDGYLDAEEINSGHNPLVKAPGDEAFLYPLPLGEKYNITQKLVQDPSSSLMGSYLNYKLEYLENNPEISDPSQFLASVPASIRNQIMEKAVYESFSYAIENSKEIFEQFPEIFDMKISDQEINIIENNSKEAIDVYFSQLTLIFDNDFFFQKNGAEAFEKALETEYFLKLSEIIKLNDPKIEKLKQMPVPLILKDIHKEALRTSILARNIFISIRDLQSDPIKALLFSQKINETFNDWLNLLNKISDFAKQYEE